MRLVVVGTGYVGLVTGACFADFGHDVTCVDKDCSKIDLLTGGGIPIFEPGLQDLVQANRIAARLHFSSDLRCSVQDADAVFIAVGTPSRRCDGHADLSHVYSVARDMAAALPSRAVVIVKSTVPVGTCDEVERIIHSLRPESALSVVSNPEFLRAGAAVQDFMAPDRIVIGAEDDIAREKVTRIYRSMFRNSARFVQTSRRSSELIKYTANALLATKVAFINEISDLCEQVGANIHDVACGVGLDRRIGAQFLQAGPGFGGSCFGKDALALVKMGEDHASAVRIIEAVLHANETRKRTLIRKVRAAVGGSLRDKRIGVLGLTFKADTDDMRESPAIPLITALIDAGALVRAYDPAGMQAAKALLPEEVAYARNGYEAARKADALLVMTEWADFRALDLERVRTLMATPVVVDMRGLYDAGEMSAKGFRYHGIGMAAPACHSDEPSPKKANGARLATNGNGRALQLRSDAAVGPAASP